MPQAVIFGVNYSNALAAFNDTNLAYTTNGTNLQQVVVSAITSTSSFQTIVRNAATGDSFDRYDATRVYYVVKHDVSPHTTYEYDLVITDGTQAGTTVTNIYGGLNHLNNFNGSASNSGAIVGELAGLVGSKVLFVSGFNSGTGVQPTINFVISDGTVGGTSSFSVAAAPLPYKETITGFVTTGSQVFFAATDLTGKQALWVSDGTASGTHVVTVNGAAASGLNPANLTPFGNSVIFSGADAAGNTGLWISDGTTAGTVELKATTGANAGSNGSLSPDIAVLPSGAYVYFFANPGSKSNLWVTDGTAAGTHDIRIGGALPTNSAGAQIVNPSSAAAFQGGWLFSAKDASNHISLFKTNGTDAGSFAIPLASAAVDPKVHGIVPGATKAYFEATDANGKVTLWVTDGTSAGTSEILPAKAYSQGVVANVEFTNTAGNDNAVVVGDTLYFEGQDDLGQYGIWVSDGTSAGTHVIPGTTLPFRETVSLTGLVAASSGPETLATLSAAYRTVLRATPNESAAATLLSLATQVATASMTLAQAEAKLPALAANTTSVATLAYQFFTGSTPGAAGMDYLVSPTGPNSNNLNASYYQSFNLENRYINFSVNLGKYGAGQASFQAHYGNLTLSAALSQAYATIFGTAPTAAKVDLLLNSTLSTNGVTQTRAEYFASYGGDGVTGIGTKAAMVGWLLAEAVKADVGDYALSNDAFLSALASGQASFGVDLIGQFNKASYHYLGG